MTWRKKWEKTWDQVKYCSDACRRQTPDATDAALEAAIVALLSARAGEATICPSEAARAVSPDDWAGLMERTRRAGRRLAAAGVLDVTQGGRVVDAAAARGAIRYLRGRRWAGRGR